MDWRLIVAGLCGALSVNLVLVAVAWWYLADAAASKEAEANGR